MNIHQLLFDNPDYLIEILRGKNNLLYTLVSRFRNYVDSYTQKIDFISNKLKSEKDSCHFHCFENKLTKFNRQMKVVESPHEINQYLDKIFEEIGEIKVDLSQLKQILALVINYIIKQEKYFTINSGKNFFREHIREWISLINEEASVLFCYLVKKTFEFMDAPEKQAIVRLNRFALPFLNEKPTDETETIVNQALSIIDLSTSTHELFKGLLGSFKRITGIRCIQLLIVEPELKEIDVKMYAYVAHLPMYDTAHEGGVISKAVEKKKVILVNSVYEYPGYDIFDATIRSELVMPIKIMREIYGVLNFEDDHLNRFTQEFVSAIQRICECISQKIDSFPDRYSLKKMMVS